MKQKVLKLIIDGVPHPLNKDKILIGSGDNCDLIVGHNSISHYHCMVFISSDGEINISDLNSTNGTYINGEKVSKLTPMFDGDSISLGKLHCEVISSNEKIDFIQHEKEVQTYQELQTQKVYVPQASNENEILIDDEYCDIKFDDSSFQPFNINPLRGHKVDSHEYIETDDIEEGYDILQENTGTCLQVTTSLNGSILEQYYFPFQDGTIYSSNKARKNNVVIDILSTNEKIPFLKIENNNVQLQPIEDFQASSQSLKAGSNDVLVLSRGTYQVFIESAEAPGTLLHISSLKREQAFFKDTAKKFAAAIFPMLLLLLVDFTPDVKKEEKKLSIIYKKPTKANVDGKKMASSNPNSKNKNTGHKSTKQPDKKISHSKAGKKAQPKKAQPKKVAKSAPKKSKAVKSKTRAKTKAYSFKMASNVSSVFSSSKTVAVANNNAPSTVKTSASVTGSLDTKVNGTASDKVGNMGSDASGRSTASFGSKGLSSKSGRDTAYIQTETVVLGSMDPELLRKILQQYLPQFRHCYQQELVYNSEDIKGIVDLNFEITGSGKVSKINVRPKDSRFSKKGTNCMAKVLAIIDFPKPKGGGRVAVRQPLSFYSEQEKG
ncbi:MAG: hypothetical protein CME66_07075 [Halobacteriovoraceae bacterium]|jgi:virulence-associated protein VapD|nr:hypothetical protein [Halobacteriovoraceae bacterium]